MAGGRKGRGTGVGGGKEAAESPRLKGPHRRKFAIERMSEICSQLVLSRIQVTNQRMLSWMSACLMRKLGVLPFNFGVL
eukprot:scaffold385_cov305-Pinguiococcus_pyrenoidosus.AAC.35